MCYCENWRSLYYTDGYLSAGWFILSCKPLVLASLVPSWSSFYLEGGKKSLSWPLRDIFLSLDILFWIPPLHQGADTWLCVNRAEILLVILIRKFKSCLSTHPLSAPSRFTVHSEPLMMASLCPQFPNTGILRVAQRAACLQSMQITQT